MTHTHTRVCIYAKKCVIVTSSHINNGLCRLASRFKWTGGISDEILVFGPYESERFGLQSFTGCILFKETCNKGALFLVLIEGCRRMPRNERN